MGFHQAGGWSLAGFPRAPFEGHFSILFSSMICHTGLEDVLSTFANDIKLGGTVSSIEGGEDLQRGVLKLENCLCTNHMKYNKNKCLTLHLGRGNPGLTN